MIESIEALLKRTENFNDSQELADALIDMADYDDGVLRGTSQYYIKESAVHIEGMFKHVMALHRAVLMLQRRLNESSADPAASKPEPYDVTKKYKGGAA